MFMWYVLKELSPSCNLPSFGEMKKFSLPKINLTEKVSMCIAMSVLRWFIVIVCVVSNRKKSLFTPIIS